MANKTSNRIPRSARTLQVEFLIDTSGTKKGEIVTVHKNDSGWIGQVASGERLYFFVSMLRNSGVCKILSAA